MTTLLLALLCACAPTVALPTTTVSTNRLDVGFVYNLATSDWRCVATA
jgi:hypothetical protein